MIRYYFTVVIAIVFIILIYNFISSLNMKKKINYYKHANHVITSVLSDNDKANDKHQYNQHKYIYNIKTNGYLTDEEIIHINERINHYNSVNSMY